MDVVFVDIDNLNDNVTVSNSQSKNDTIADSEVVPIDSNDITTSLMNKSSPAGRKNNTNIFLQP